MAIFLSKTTAEMVLSTGIRHMIETYSAFGSSSFKFTKTQHRNVKSYKTGSNEKGFIGQSMVQAR